MNSLTYETYYTQSKKILRAPEDYRLTTKLGEICYLWTIHFVTALSNISCTCSIKASVRVGKNHQEMAERFLIMVRSHLPFIFLWNELFIHQLTIHFKMQFFLTLKLSSSQLYKKKKTYNWGLYSARQLYDLFIDFSVESQRSNT